METYLMMLYVTLDQESALKKFFDDQGWSFCKPDLSVTTDKLGPTIGSKAKESPSPVILGKRKAITSTKLAPKIKFVKIVSSNTGDVAKDLHLVSQDAKNGNEIEEEEPETKDPNAANDSKLDQEELDNKMVSETIIKEKGKENDSYGDEDQDEEVVSDDKEEVVCNDIDDVINNDLDDVGDEGNDDTDDSVEEIHDENTEEKLDGTSMFAKDDTPGQKGREVVVKNFPSQTIDKEDTGIMEQDEELTPTNDERKVVYTCEICGRQYLSKPTLMRHRKTHLCPFYCRSCSMAFNTADKLDQHNQEKHSHNFSCPTCGKNFKRKSSLSVHNETIHLSVQRFQCTWPDCDKSFFRQDVLNDHMNTHTGVRPYTCQKCLKTYSSKSSLNHHWKACKTDGLACNVCGQVLSSRSGLADHIQGMHEKTPLPCLCGQVFTWRNNLLKHKKNCAVFHASKT